MSRLASIREKRNLTQKELAENSGISVRTIQRIEAGTEPKGYTLKILTETLNVSEEELLGKDKPAALGNKKILILINLSGLLFFIPFGNILFPLLLIRKKNEKGIVARQLLDIQILWSITAFLVVGISPFLVRWVGASRQITLQLAMIFILINLFIIIRNAISLSRHKKLYFRLNFSFL